MGAERIPGIEVAEGRNESGCDQEFFWLAGVENMSKGVRRVKVWQAGKCMQLAAEVCGTWRVGKGAAG